ncbi:MAG TPA: Ig-like domain-containing protein, partial [Chitinophagaceae bacterium]
RIQFNLQYDPSLAKEYKGNSEIKLNPREVNVFEESNFEAYTTEFGVYDTVKVSFGNTNNGAKGAVSPLYHFIGHSIPIHDAVTIRIKPGVFIDPADQAKLVIKNIAGTRTYITKANKSGNWYTASFRQFGNYQLFVDNTPPVINNIPTDLSKSTRIAFTPTDNFNTITYFRAELDGKWLRFTNNRGKTWLYYFDENFTKGEHELKVEVEDAAGNRTTRTWKVKR